MLDHLSLPQVRALLMAREDRIREDRRWQILVAGLPQQYAEGLIDLLDGGYEYGVTPSGDVVAPGAPLLHEITESQARIMGIPIKFVKVTEDADARDGSGLPGGPA